jgi:tripartite-type tricarboxylate transporter receptor subunit TctC
VGIPSLRALITLAKSKPGQLTFASASSGSVSHLIGEMLKQMAGIDIVHVPYKGAGPALIDVMGGHIGLMFAGGPSAAGAIKAGRLKLIAVAALEHSPAFPAAPTMAEAGLPGADARGWWGVVAPAGTPRSIVTQLNGEINRALALPDIRERYAREGATPQIMTPEEFGAFITSEIEKWAKVVKGSGARVD